MEIKQLKERFKAEFKGNISDIHVYFSPGRVNLIGEHTDYNGGYVFPCTISFGTYCLINKTNTDLFRFVSLNNPYKAEIKIKDITKPLNNQWVNYPMGVITQFIKKGNLIDSGCDIIYYGDVPKGAGLSSSASLEMATAYAINDVYKFGTDKVILALMSQKAEHEFAGVHCGIMDQFASGMGKKDKAIFLNCDTLEYEMVPVILKNSKIIISNTNSPHKLDSGKYNERVAECKAAIEAIKPYKNISLLGELSYTDFLNIEDKIYDDRLRRRARHVITEIKRTREAVKELKNGNINKFGELMNQSHDSLRDNYEVTGFHLDTMVDEARKIDGVIGSRMTGGGFGGSTVSIVRNESIDKFIKEVGQNYFNKTRIKPDFYIAEIVEGSHKIE